MAAYGTTTQANIALRGTVRPSAGGVWSILAKMVRARQTRHLLAEMDDRMLADIGIDRGQAHMEAMRPMWDMQPRR